MPSKNHTEIFDNATHNDTHIIWRAELHNHVARDIQDMADRIAAVSKSLAEAFPAALDEHDQYGILRAALDAHLGELATERHPIRAIYFSADTGITEDEGRQRLTETYTSYAGALMTKAIHRNGKPVIETDYTPFAPIAE